MLRTILGIILLAFVLRTLAGCTINLTLPSAPAPVARPAAAPPPPPRRVINPCGMVNCNSNTRSIV